MELHLRPQPIARLLTIVLLSMALLGSGLSGVALPGTAVAPAAAKANKKPKCHKPAKAMKVKGTWRCRKKPKCHQPAKAVKVKGTWRCRKPKARAKPAVNVPSVCVGADDVPTAANLATVRAAADCLVNHERLKAGLAPLADHPQLRSAALTHVVDMVSRGFFAHNNLDGIPFFERILSTGYVGEIVGENLSYGTGTLATARASVNGWMGSPGHRANILQGDYSESGVAAVLGTPSGKAGATFAQEFGGHQ
jgi:uncharacterized protein YkwD